MLSSPILPGLVASIDQKWPAENCAEMQANRLEIQAKWSGNRAKMLGLVVVLGRTSLRLTAIQLRSFDSVAAR
jgi:hypothetical protein